jgi:site-specific DNA-methyltransferase (adenine-specific)
VVLDPFFGAGTVGLVARELGRDWLGVELNPEYVEIAKERLGREQTQIDEAAA